ncbi:AmmeMemoRadiSam system radical SAM enzyme [Thermoproteus tenax]|uniref:Pyruvate formate-lyase activating enzyme n=1 Tax=Thermoproteus tenax (strain ATCC 35583 / DSM 2078 / JCM 9277 / NBRC 100435 / Kra 1) TaxID=768679 RepID=G4RL34_THETK|nr:AmmeMemoRadiSam system radical SAM enzyme [Thermoproteus tenax]CCC82279.1 pyruvate formate-lyase activating enzyme [Thermoproteus tenax Kra 1]
MREATLYRRLDERRVVCTACARYCRLNPGVVGFCGVRVNLEGKLYLAVYGLISAIAVDPIEKKPLTHFYPGAMVLSLSTFGCNWACQYCQNFDISQRRRIEGFEMPPERVVELAETYGAHGITYTYNEPTIFAEYAHDIGVLARQRGLFNTFVTNGYMTPEAVEYIAGFLDAATVDFKGNGNKRFLGRFSMVPDVEPVFQTLEEMRRRDIWVEITDLVVPRYGDNLEDARRLVKRVIDILGPETPIHFLRFHPDYKMMDLSPTPIETLERHVEVAKEEGAKYVYVGNVPGHKYEHTYCPECGRPVIKRYGFDILEINLVEKGGEYRCKFCGAKINIRGRILPTWKLESRFAYVPIHLLTRYVRRDTSKEDESRFK